MDDWQQKAIAFTEIIKQSPIDFEGVRALRSALSIRNRKIIKGDINLDSTDVDGNYRVFDNFFIEEPQYKVFTIKPNEFVFSYHQTDFLDYLDNEGKGLDFTGEDVGFDDIWIFEDEEGTYEYAFDDGRRFRIKAFGMVKTDASDQNANNEDINFYAVVGIYKSSLFSLVNDPSTFRWSPETLARTVKLDEKSNLFCKAVISGTYNIEKNTFSNRYLGLLIDGGSEVIGMNDPEELFLHIDPKNEEQGIALLEKLVSAWEEYHDLLSIFHQYFKLPTYAGYQLTIGSRKKHKKKPVNTQPGSKAFSKVYSKIKKQKKYAEISVKSLRYNPPANRRKKSTIIMPILQWQMTIRGYWRRLYNPTTIGKDQRGDFNQLGKTWVETHIRNRDLTRRDVVFRKLKISEARKKKKP